MKADTNALLRSMKARKKPSKQAASSERLSRVADRHAHFYGGGGRTANKAINEARSALQGRFA